MTRQKRTTRLTLADWDRLRAVLALHRGGTLSAAAKVLGVDHTTVARRLNAIERDFKSMLFERGKLGFTATPFGEEVVAAAEQVEGEIDGLLRRLDGASSNLTGRIRLTATPLIAASLVAPALEPFARDNPSLDIELVGDGRQLDLSAREADAAIRLARPQSPTLIARRLGHLAFAFYAACSDERPFASQRFLAFEEPFGNTTLQRRVADILASEKIVLRSNNMHALLEAARAGLGAAALPCFVAESDQAWRRLTAPLAIPQMDLWLIYHQDLRRSPRIKAMSSFIDDLVKTKRRSLVPPGFPFDPS